MENVEEDESEEHESGVEDVLVSFVAGNAAVDALGVFDETENYTDLVERRISDGFLGIWGWEWVNGE